jgi:phage terminase small subunit
MSLLDVDNPLGNRRVFSCTGMADKLTPKQERFCLKYIETGNASEAYRLAYNAKAMKPETINREAKTLIDNPKVATRIQEIRDKHQKRHDVTVDSITAELDESRNLAMKDRQHSAAITASMGKAKLHGLITEKAVINADIEVSGGITIYMPDNGRTKRD